MRRRLSRSRELLAEAGANAEGAASLADVARAAGMSKFHFLRIFEAMFGATPHQFRTAARLERARVLLARGAAVTDACFEVGFASVGSFSSLFARRVGESPIHYQRRVRPLVQVPGALERRFYPGCFSLLGMLPVRPA